MKFNEQEVIKSMREFEIAFINDAKFDNERPMGNVARSFVGFIVSAAFVGLFSEVRSSLAKFQEWLGRAIDNREKFGNAPEFHFYRLNEALGIANWLAGESDHVTWKAALNAELKATHEERAYLPRDMKTLRLDELMPVAMFAGESALAKSEYEASIGASVIKRGSAVPLRKYGYFVASSWPYASAEREEIFAWGRKILALNLDGWISRGHYITAAKWVCLIYTTIGGCHDAAEALASALRDAKSASL